MPIVCGIRHHGPGSAASLVHALDAVQPDAVLLEWPREAEPTLALAGDPELRPPVAQLAYVSDHPERAVFSPLAAYSPEWCAVRWAIAHGVPLRCIDLPAADSFALAASAAGDDLDDLDDRRVDAIGVLSQMAGYDDPEDWWDDVVEHRGQAASAGQAVVGRRSLDVFAAVGEAMTALRAAHVPGRVEALREAAMRQGIRSALRDGAARPVVVCGAWHVPALVGTAPADDRAGDDAAALRQLAKANSPRPKVTVTWVPWTHRRLAAASGYGAGVVSPGWYAHVFAHPGPAGVSRWFARVAALLRAADLSVSPDHLIAASRLATALAALRGRPQPGLAEMTDAAHAVLADGRSAPLALIHDRLVVGDEIGTVPESTPMVPLARDLAVQQRRARLKPEAAERTLELDLRLPLGLARSRLLHRLWVLDVPWGRPEESRRSAGTFRETWRVRWDPELSVRLVERSAEGTTVESAATARLLSGPSRRTPAVLVELTADIELALLADLPAAVGPLVRLLASRAAHDTDIAHLMDALVPLARALRYGDVRATDVAALHEVVDGLVVRICAGLRTAMASLDDGAARTAAARLGETQASLELLAHPARHGDWPAAVASLARPPAVSGATPGVHGLVRGRATRLLLDSGRWSPEEVQTSLARTLSGGTPVAEGAAFVEGLLAGSGTILLHDDALLGLLDGWIATLAADAFVDLLPLLRRTFSSFESAERRLIGQRLAHHGDVVSPAPFGWDIDEARAGAGLATVRTILGGEP